MDDIYDNLENYDDVNVIEELKSENSVLKLQIEKYAKILDQLQKDFDKLSSEYKKLEMNYSSLLKTARAEIERKAHLIKTLNAEKDMLIIKTFQKRGVNISKPHRSSFHERQQIKHHETDLNKSNRRQNKVDSTGNNNRLNNPSIDTISNVSTENKSISGEDKVLKKFQNESYTNNEEDNAPKNSDEEGQKKVVSKKIMSRRKSMPATSFQNTYSSDEDVERYNVENIKKSPVRNARYDTKDYRTSTRRYHESKESGRHSNCSDYKKSKHNEKYDPLQHFRRRYSRERRERESSLSYSSREYNKRVLRSPPPDRYNRSKSRDRRKHNELAHRQTDRHTHQNDPSNYKHKIQNDLEEPSSKRQKIESISIDKEKELSERMSILPEELSCQSPDYLHDTHFTQHLVKEIMNTDATHLEDPRILSTKYILQTHKDKQYLSTVVGRNINLKYLDKSAWGIDSCFPDALKIKPSVEEESRELINEIYMDVENTELNDFVESGDIHIVDDVVDLYTEKINKNTNNLDSIKNIKIQNVLDVPNPILDSKESRKSLSSKYKIPKIKKPDKVSKLPEKDADENQKPFAKDNNNINIEITGPELKLKWEGTLENHTQHSQINDDTQVPKNRHENIDNNKHSKPIINKRIEDILATVEGDLELSDEEDVIDSQKQNIEKNDGKQLKIQIDKKLKNKTEKETHKHLKIKISKETLNQVSVISSDKNNIDSTYNEHKSIVSSTSCTITSDEIVAKECFKEDCTSTKESRETKKRKTKKKLDSKETFTKPKESNIEEAKKTKEHEQSISKPNINKFSDLFGDSSSLITLDDLGIPISNKLLPDAKFPCIFENTEDAVDLSVEDITKIQSTGNVTSFNTDGNLPKNDTNVHEKVLNPIGKNDTETTSHLYENVKPELLIDTHNIVKTVIISTGAQPKSLSGSTSDIATVTKSSMQGLEALATSTPNKIINTPPYINGTSTTKDLSSSINHSDSQAETEVPDLRIFVRRRRKTIKKS